MCWMKWLSWMMKKATKGKLLTLSDRATFANCCRGHQQVWSDILGLGEEECRWKGQWHVWLDQSYGQWEETSFENLPWTLPLHSTSYNTATTVKKIWEVWMLLHTKLNGLHFVYSWLLKLQNYNNYEIGIQYITQSSYKWINLCCC